VAATTWRHRVAEVWPYATAATSLLFVTCVLVGWFVTWQGGPQKPFTYILAATDPALAALGMLAICAVRPDVFAGKRFRMPHVLTLPFLYVLIVFAIKSLSRNSESGIRRFEGAERFDLIWSDARVALQALVAMAVVMALVGIVLKEKES
jgi:hypothetical protein